MPDSSWFCTSCKQTNPPYTEVCRECGIPAAPSLAPLKHGQPTQTNLEKGIPEGPAWFSEHPIAGVTFMFLISAPLLLNFFPSSPAASPGFVVVLFAMGLPSLILLLLGFASIFGPTFFRLGVRDQAIAAGLGALITLPSLGAVALVYVFARELQIQLTCSGGACAQGGMGTMLFVLISWAGGILASGMSHLFSRWKWWPSPLKPSFGVFD